MAEEEKEIIQQDSDMYGKVIQPMPKEPPKVGVDLSDALMQTLADAAINNTIDKAALGAFSSLAQSRDRAYTLIDTMCDDSTIAAVLETYVEDATEYNAEGNILWAESSDEQVLKMVNNILEAMSVNKNIYRWMACLCKYGDVYLRLFRTSQYDRIYNATTGDKTLNESIYAIKYSENDKYATYVEMMPNPAEMFELTALGKTVGFIKADVSTLDKHDGGYALPYYTYTFSDNNILIYEPTEFVHAYLEDTSSRVPETVEIVREDATSKEDIESVDSVTKRTYSVRRGQSLFYNAYRAWRNLTLLENSMLLNRVTKSSIVRIVEVETGSRDPKEIAPYLRRIKTLFEQKMAFSSGEAMNEYTNPGPIENTVYVPKHGDVGAISINQTGGDVDVKNIADVEYYRDKMFGALKVPKHFFSNTDDSVGFNGGTSLSLISSRYAKTIKRLQNTMVQMVTTLVNLMLMDRDLDGYVNKFTIKMLPPTTQEELDRQANLASRVQFVGDVMGVLGDIEEPVDRLKIVKSLLSNIISDQEAMDVIEDVIQRKEKERAETENPTMQAEDEEEDMGFGGRRSFPSTDTSPRSTEIPSMGNTDTEAGFSADIETNISSENETETGLPDMGGMGVDFTDNGEF